MRTLYKQNKDYTCGVAAVRSLLGSMREFSVPSEDKLEDHLNTTKKYGTTPNEILTYLLSKNIVMSIVPREKNKVRGICLVNVNTFFNEYPKDGQNGHWVYFERTEDRPNTIRVFDPWKNQLLTYDFKAFRAFTKNIRLKKKIYHNLFLYQI